MKHWIYLLAPLLCLIFLHRNGSIHSSSVTNHTSNPTECPLPHDLQSSSIYHKQDNNCVDILQLLLDHMLHRARYQLPEPITVGNIASTVFELKNGLLYGLNQLQRTCNLSLEREIQSENLSETIGRNLTSEHSRILIHLDFCMGISKNLLLTGDMTVWAFWNTYGPERVSIKLAGLSIQPRLTIVLGKAADIHVKLSKVRVTRLDNIAFETDSDLSSSMEEPSNGLITNYGGTVQFLVNGPLYTPLIIMLEGALNGSFSAILQEKNLNDW